MVVANVRFVPMTVITWSVFAPATKVFAAVPTAAVDCTAVSVGVPDTGKPATGTGAELPAAVWTASVPAGL